jgi:Mg-chelatase subunit ChlD
MSKRIAKQNFFTDKGGNVSIMFAVSLMAILGISGLALDITDTIKRKSTLQSASDAAVLSAAISGETKIKKLEALARAAFENNFQSKQGEVIKTFKLNLSQKNELSLVVEMEKPTLLMGIAGFDTVDASVQSATFLRSASPIDIAFVLDRTGSMAGRNMTDLINASRGLITELDAGDREIRIAVVPFSDYVNIGINGLDMSLLDLPGTGAAGSDVICAMENASTSDCTSGSSGGTSGSGTPTGSCATSGGGTCTATTTTTTSSGSTTTTTTTSSSGASPMSWTDVFTTTGGAFCTTSPDPQESSGSLIEECTPVQPTENWFGCVGSRLPPYNQTVDYAGERFPPVFDRTCGEPMVPLTDDLVRARASIDSLTASGSTYIPAGLQWGWRALDTSRPFDHTPSLDRNKLLILMTDGQNTRSQEGILHTGFDRTAANALTADLCEKIKNSDIQVATVSYSNGGTSGADTTMLKACASSDGLYYEARNAATLRKAFESAIDQANTIRLIR